MRRTRAGATRGVSAKALRCGVRAMAATVALLLVPAADWAQAVPGRESYRTWNAGPIDTLDACRHVAGIDADGDENVEYICANIVDAWKGVRTTGSDNKAADFDEQKSVLIIDLSDRSVRGAPLLRLLSHPKLLPPFVFGGLMLRGGTIKGPLVFDHLHMSYPITLSNMQIEGETVTLEEYGQKDKDNVALMMRHARIEAQLKIVNTKIVGDIRIRDSTIENLAFRGTLQESDKNKVSSNGIFVEINLTKNNISSLLMSKTTFNGHVKIIDNMITTFTMYNSDMICDRRSADDGCVVDISSNNIADSFTITNLNVDADSSDKPFASGIWMSNNTVDGVTRINGVQLARSMKRIDLTFNRFNAYADVRSPAILGDYAPVTPWPGEMDLTGVRAPSLLRIGPPADAASANLGALQNASEGGRQCREDARTSATRINLTTAKIGVFAWNLPDDCRYRWLGAGLRYDHWGDPDQSASSPGQGGNPQGQGNARPASRTDRLAGWHRQLLTGRKDALMYMAEYLDSRGELLLSRDMLERAKETDWVSRTYGDYRNRLRWPLVAALWVGGYGAAPERALGTLIGVCFLFTLIYMAYSWHAAGREPWRSGGRAMALEATNPGDGETAASTKVPGFMQFDQKLRPQHFHLWQYSVDAMVPLINLHAYDRYYPDKAWMRVIASFQHIVGIILWAVFITTAAIL